MENFFFSLNVIFFALYIYNFTTWVTDGISPIFCAVVSFFAILPFMMRTPSRPLCEGPRNIQKSSRKPCHWRKRKPQDVVKACRFCLRELDEIGNLLIILKRLLRELRKRQNIPGHDPFWSYQHSQEDSPTVMSPPSSSPSPPKFLKPRTSTCYSSSTFSISDSLPLSRSEFSFPQQCFSPPPPPPPSLSPSMPSCDYLEWDSYPPSSPGFSESNTSISSLVRRDCNTWQLATIDHGSSQSSHVSVPASIRILSGVGQANNSVPTICWYQMSSKTLFFQFPSASSYRSSSNFKCCREL